MANLSIQRVLALPGTVAPSTIYIVKAAGNDHVELYFTSNDGLETRRVLTTADVQALLTTATVANANTADALSTPRTISASGDATWSVSFDGSANATAALTLSASGAVAGTYTKVTVDTKGRVTTASNLTAADIPNLDAAKITSGTLTVGTSGNAATATKLAAPVTINGESFDGSANITINAVDSTARIAVSEKGAVNGVATLDAAGKVPATQLPSYVDDVLEFADEASLPTTGESGKIYITVDNNYSFRWTGSAYTRIGSDVSTADSAVKLTTARTITATGDADWQVSFDGSANVTAGLTLATTGVVANTYTKVTVDAKGRVTAGAALTASDIPSLDSTKVTSAASITLTADEW